MSTDHVMNRIELLLWAADVLERRDSELSDHGYASTQSIHRGGAIGGGSAAGRQRRRTTSRSSAASLSSSWPRGSGGVRTLHNEMEKTRRANLRHCLERLKNVMPTGELAKNTTLQLLKRAKLYIAKLEHEQSHYQKIHADLNRQQAELNRALTMTATIDAKVAAPSEPTTSSSSSKGTSGSARYRLRSVGSASSEAGSPISRPSSAAGAFFNYRLRADSYSPSASSPSAPESASDISDDIDIMGTGSDSDEYGH